MTVSITRNVSLDLWNLDLSCWYHKTTVWELNLNLLDIPLNLLTLILPHSTATTMRDFHRRLVSYPSCSTSSGEWDSFTSFSTRKLKWRNARCCKWHACKLIEYKKVSVWSPIYLYVRLCIPQEVWILGSLQGAGGQAATDGTHSCPHVCLLWEDCSYSFCCDGWQKGDDGAEALVYTLCKCPSNVEQMFCVVHVLFHVFCRVYNIIVGLFIILGIYFYWHSISDQFF